MRCMPNSSERLACRASRLAGAHTQPFSCAQGKAQAPGATASALTGSAALGAKQHPTCTDVPAGREAAAPRAGASPFFWDGASKRWLLLPPLDMLKSLRSSASSLNSTTFAECPSVLGMLIGSTLRKSQEPSSCVTARDERVRHVSLFALYDAQATSLQRALPPPESAQQREAHHCLGAVRGLARQRMIWVI